VATFNLGGEAFRSPAEPKEPPATARREWRRVALEQRGDVAGAEQWPTRLGTEPAAARRCGHPAIFASIELCWRRLGSGQQGPADGEPPRSLGDRTLANGEPPPSLGGRAPANGEHPPSLVTCPLDSFTGRAAACCFVGMLPQEDGPMWWPAAFCSLPIIPKPRKVGFLI